MLEYKFIQQNSIDKMKTTLTTILLFISLVVFAGDVIICKSKNAYAYHSSNCRGMKNCKHLTIIMDQSEAIKRGYKPCGYCYK